MYLVWIINLLLVLGFGTYYLVTQLKTKQLKQELDAKQAAIIASQTQVKQDQEEIKKLKTTLQPALVDSVTHLPGWLLFEDRVSQSIKSNQRYHVGFGLLCIDIDDFKLINDVFGQEDSNGLLVEVGRRIQASIRTNDSVSRLIKDQFGALLLQISRPETVAIVAQRILQEIAKPFVLREQEVYITVSIGIAICPLDGEDRVLLWQCADQAMREAKKQGKNRFQFYSATTHERSQRELALKNSLKQETLFQELIIYYEPIMDIQKERVSFMEVSVYWQHPQLGLIDSLELADLAAKEQKMSAITLWILDNACKKLLHWHSLGFFPEGIAVPVNLTELSDTHFIYEISVILQKHQFKPEWLLLIINETKTAALYHSLEKTFNMLKYLKIGLAADNFASNLLTLYYFKQISFQYLKLDKIFIADLSNKKSMAIMKAMLTLAESLSAKIIVQGVESENQKAILYDLGCYLMQGKLLGMPLKENEVTEQMIE